MSSDPSVDLVLIERWENDMVQQFDLAKGRKWREGNSKMSFTYLLLDPRTTKNLPGRHKKLGMYPVIASSYHFQSSLPVINSSHHFQSSLPSLPVG